MTAPATSAAVTSENGLSSPALSGPSTKPQLILSALALVAWGTLAATGTVHAQIMFNPLVFTFAMVASIPLALVASMLFTLLFDARPRFMVQRATLDHAFISSADAAATASAIKQRAARIRLQCVDEQGPVFKLAHGAGSGSGIVDDAVSLPISVEVHLSPDPRGTRVQLRGAIETIMAVTSDRPVVLRGVLAFLAQETADPFVRQAPILLSCGLIIGALFPWLALVEGADSYILAWALAVAVLDVIGLVVVVMQPRAAAGGLAGVLSLASCIVAVVTAFLR